MVDPTHFNELAQETSPYLLQHRDNPVHWLPFDRRAFDRARAENKPIMLSVGYAACHWCHVMAHESFEDEETARLLNSEFISIKVDREERPDVDRLYMDAIHAFGEQGGWPLTMFLDTEGNPFWGGTYFPKEPRFGRPSFRQVLTEIARIWKTERQKIETNTAHIRDRLTTTPPAQAPLSLSAERLKTTAQTLLGAVDFQHGGLKGAPKFPQVPLFDFLWRHYRRTGDERSQLAVRTLLTHISQGGIYDHLAGGFARYSVDPLWLVPHFEKMLYDNAQLLRLLARVTIFTDDRLFRQRIDQTVDFLLNHMTVADGAFAASYDADSEGEEGRYYVWSAAEIDAALSPADAQFFRQVYGVTEEGNFDGHNILNRLADLALLDPDEEDRLTAMARRLLAIRDQRIPPGFDDKVLSDWNGLAIAAIAEAGLLLDRPDWVTAAATAYAAVLKLLWNGDRLQQSWRAGQGRYNATADGYANLIDASIALYEATADHSYLAIARQLTQSLIRQHWDETRAGFTFASREADNLIARPCYAHDDATPNANATLMASLLKLSLATGDSAYADRAARIFDSFSAQAFQNPFAHGSFLNACDDILNLSQLVLLGNADAAKPLRHAALVATTPAKLILHADPAHQLAERHPAAGKVPIDGKPTLYVCVGTRCSLPVTTPAELSSAFAALTQS